MTFFKGTGRNYANNITDCLPRANLQCQDEFDEGYACGNWTEEKTENNENKVFDMGDWRDQKLEDRTESRWLNRTDVNKQILLITNRGFLSTGMGFIKLILTRIVRMSTLHTFVKLC